MNLCKHYISINYILIKNLAWTLWPVLKLAQGKHENKHLAALAACSWRGRRQDNEWCGSGDKLQISASPASPAQPSPGLSVNADQRSVELFYTRARHRTGRSTPAKYSAVSGEVSGDLRGSASTIVTIVPACRVLYTLLY